MQISFPEPGDKKDIVSLRGPKEDVEKSAVHLKKLAADLVRGGQVVGDGDPVRCGQTRNGWAWARGVWL